MQLNDAAVKLGESIICESVPCTLCGAEGGLVVASGYDYEYWTSPDKFYFIACKDCGHVYLNPRPIPSMLDKIYPENYYTKESRHSGSVGLIKKHVIRNRLSFFKDILGQGKNILELGCGDGALLIDIKTRYPEGSVTGVDFSFSPETIRQCRLLNIALLQADIETMELPEATYDLVIMNQLLEHLREPGQVLENIFQALRPGGMISIETPNRGGYDRKLFKNSFWGGYYFPRHMHLFGSDSLVRLIEAKGFTLMQQRPLAAPIIWVFSFSAALGRIWPVLRRPDSFSARFFSDSNPFLLGLFAAIDMIAIRMGGTTSNQKVIAQKP